MNATQISTYQPAHAGAVLDSRAAMTARIAAVADAARAAGTFAAYLDEQSANTRRAQATDLGAFAAFLAAAGHPNPPTGEELQNEPDAWRGVSASLLDAFKQWTIREGYAIGTANRRLATVKTYARLAAGAGAISTDETTRIATVKGYSAKAARHTDAQRKEQEIATRKGAKKAEFNDLDRQQCRRLKEIAAETDAAGNPTPRGRRDALLIALLLDHGLRIGEAVVLTRKDFDLERGELRFYRPKVNKTQRHRLTPDTIRAFVAYVAAGHAQDDDQPLLHRSKKNRALTAEPLDERSANDRIATLGRKIGIANLSPHDLRHTWTGRHAERASKGECNILEIQEAGGWSSLSIVRRYVKEREIANENLAISL